MCGSIMLDCTKVESISNQFDYIEQCNSNWERIGFEFGTNSPFRLWFQHAIHECIGSGHGPSVDSAGRNYESHRMRL